MTSYQSAEEVRAEMITSLGQELGETFNELQNDLVWLHIKWRQYRELYGSTPRRIDLLNNAAPLLFRVVEDSLWDEVLLHLCRLTDSAEYRGNARLSVNRLPSLIQNHDVSATVQSLVEDAVTKTSFARDWRNRRIAHRDLAHSLDRQARPLEHASRQAVEDALAALRNVLNAVNNGLLNSEMKFEYSDPVGGAEALLYVLRDGIRARDAKEKGLRDGTISIEEWIADQRAV